MTTIEHSPPHEHAAHDHAVVDESHHVHTVSQQLLFGIYAVLLFLTIVTVAVSRLDFGSANMLIAVVIATVKAAIVMTVFMHLKWDTAVNNIAFISSMLFLSLLFLFTIADVATRADADPKMGVTSPLPVRNPSEPLFAPRGEDH